MNTYEQFTKQELDSMMHKIGTMDAGFVMVEWLKRKRHECQLDLEKVEGERAISLLQGRIALIRDISQILTSIQALTEGADRARA